MELNKRQVKALLEIMGDDNRSPVLQVLKIDTLDDKIVGVCTDAYILCALELPNELRELVGKIVRRDDIVKWHKLASGKDLFTNDTIVELAQDQVYDYPEWQKILPTERTAIDEVGFNADLLKPLQVLNNNDPLYLEFYGQDKAIMAHNKGNLFVIMPIKAKR